MQINAQSFIQIEKHFSKIILLFSFLLYLQTVGFEYNFDDELVTKNHPKTSQGFKAIGKIFSSPYYEDESGYSYEYRPVSLTSFAVEHGVFGENPAISHFINTLLYAITCLLVFSLLKIILKEYNILLAVSISLLFAVFPLHTEVVASIKNREEILAMFFGLLSALILLKEKIKPYDYFLASLTFSLAVLSKQSAIVFMVIIPLMILFFSSSKSTSKVSLVFISLMLPVILFNPLENQFKVVFTIIIAYLILIIIFKIYQTNINLTRLIPNFQNPLKKEKNEVELNIETKKEDFLERFALEFDLNSFNFFLVKSTNKYLHFFIAAIFLGGIALFVFNKSLFGITAIFVAFLLVIFLENYIVFKLLLLTMLLFVFWYFELHYGLNILLFIIYLVLISKGLIVKSPLFTFFLFTTILIIATSHSLSYSFNPMTSTLSALFVFGIAYYQSSKRKGFSKFVLYFASLLFILFSSAFIISGLLEFDSALSLLSIVFFVFIISLIIIKQFRLLVLPFSVIFLLLVSSLEISKSFEKINQKEFYKYDEVSLPNVQNLANTILDNQDRPLKYFEAPLRPDSPLTLKVSTGFFILFEYVKLQLFPYPMSFYYGYAEVIPLDFSNWQVIVSIIFHLSLIVVFLFLIIKHKHPVLIFSISAYLISILPFSNFIEVLPGMMADRFTFLSSLWFLIIVVYLLFLIFKIDTINKSKINIKPLHISILSLLFISYTTITIARTNHWESPIKLMERDIQYVPKSAGAHNFLAAQYAIKASKERNFQNQNELFRKAAFHFDKSNEIDPSYFNPAYDLGRVYLYLNQPKKAKKAFERAYLAEKDNLLILIELGSLCYELNLWKESTFYLSEYINEYKNNEEAYLMIVEAYTKLGEKQKAFDYVSKLLKVFPQTEKANILIRKINELD